MSKVTAIAFVVVLLFVVAAGALIYLNGEGLGSMRMPPMPPAIEHLTTEETPTPTAEPITIVTPTPALWASPTPTSRPAAPTATPSTAAATPTATTAITPTPAASAGAPQATPAEQYSFYLDGEVIHDLLVSCVAEYLRGVVRDAKGNPLEGVRIQASDQWGNVATTTTKGDPDKGEWDIVLSNAQNVWRLVVLDDAGHPISPVVSVPHHQEGEFKNACTHLADWKRAW